ncbi:MAG: UvrB/UvrC motif-containing protein [Pirellulaceae bacterium]|nr:UvrB/UvrC motif-containing protein [Pirellulaceae bacterium]
MSDREFIDEMLREWPYDPESLNVRVASGHDGREVIQMRVDLGVLQLEFEGRPDGTRPGGYESLYDHLVAQALHDDDFELNEVDFDEIDREFVQFYHRRICWLRLQNYQKAVDDADHTIALMDFCQEYSTHDQWILSHEQYRPFVLFHRTQASALVQLEDVGPEAAIEAIEVGLEKTRSFFESHEADEHFGDDELVQRLVELRDSLRVEYKLGDSLQEQLESAIAAEEYERAAELRDEIARRDFTH